MGSSVILGINGVEYEISTPQYGYVTKIKNPFHFQRKMPIGYATFDDGTEYDIREWNGTFVLPEQQAEYLLNYYLDSDKARGIPAYIRLRKNSGFTPFGPDKGDYGNYGVTIHGIVASGPMVSPFRQFKITCNMTARSFPYILQPTIKNDGNFSIGTVTGLNFPAEFPEPSAEYGLSNQFTRSGLSYFIDRISDHYETKLNMVCSKSRAYALIYHMVNEVRTTNVTIDTQGGTFLFGIKNGSLATYVCQWIDSQVDVVHVNHNRYEFSLSFSLVSAS